MESHVWYAAYASNLCRERLMCYLQGGTPQGSREEEPACDDPTPPGDAFFLTIPHGLYFAGLRSRWGEGGVAYIAPSRTPNRRAHARAYRISCAQFQHLMRWENRTPDLAIDWRQVAEGRDFVAAEALYGYVVHLGMRDGLPILSFTARAEARPLNPPAGAYVRTIANGLRESGMADASILDYLLTCPGIAGRLSNETLHGYLYGPA